MGVLHAYQEGVLYNHYQILNQGTSWSKLATVSKVLDGTPENI